VTVTIKLLPDAVVAEVQQKLRLVLPSEPTPPVVNYESAVTLNAPMRLEFQGHDFVVPPVSYTDGLTLQLLAQKHVALGKLVPSEENLRRFLDVLEEFAALFWRLVEFTDGSPKVRPKAEGPITRWWRRMRRRPVEMVPVANPFLEMTEGDVAWLIDFFWTCRTKQSASRVAGDAGSLARRISTLPTS
jgi:hypothetical protein